MAALTSMVFKQGFLTTPSTKCRGCPTTHTSKEGLSRSVHHGGQGTQASEEGLSRSVHRGCQGTHLLRKDYPILYIVGTQAPILLKNYPVLYIMGAHTIKEGLSRSRGFPVLHIVGARAPIFLEKKNNVHFCFQVQYVTVFMHRPCFSTGA